MRYAFSSAILAFIAVTGITSCVNVPAEQHTSFETVTLAPQSLDVPLTFSAALSGKGDVSIIPQTSGQLMSVCVAPGQKVNRGDKLFIIDSRQAKQALDASLADLQAAEAQCSSASLEYESNKNLFEKKIVSSYMLNTSLNDLNRAKASVAQAKAAVDNARLRLSFCTITSPVSGIVGNIPNNPGDMVSEMTRLTIVSGNTEMKASFSIPEDMLKEAVEEAGSMDNLLKTLPATTLVLKDGTVYPYKGKVTNFSGVVDNATGSLSCDAKFPNPDGTLFSGMQGNVQMVFSYDDIIVVPLSAMVRVQDKAYVYKVKDNCAESVIVDFIEVGNGKDVVLLDGVAEGDVIVAKGAGNVTEGQQVIFPEGEDKQN